MSTKLVVESCTCSSTTSVVYLDGSVTHGQKSEEDEEEKSSSSSRHDRRRQILFRNLELFGWSPVALYAAPYCSRTGSSAEPSDEVDDDTDNKHMSITEFLQQHKRWKDLHEDMFRNTQTTLNHEGNAKHNYTSQSEQLYRLKFITSESGSTDPTVVEAKQSWELQFCSSPPNAANNSPPHVETANFRNQVQRRMESWAEILHNVAVQVRCMLGLPENLLLHEGMVQNNHEDSGATNNNIRRCDVLRAFSYDRVVPSIHGVDDAIGSSPHTDWGSFTIVWQDDTPDSCLQSYCPVHDTWKDLSTTATTMSSPQQSTASDDGQEYVYFIVHVGDMMSLAVNHALEVFQSTRNLQQQQQQANVVETTQPKQRPQQRKMTLWPSPRHRVLSPVSQKRNSLVYFAYPPSNTTLESITQGLVCDWISLCNAPTGKGTGDDEGPISWIRYGDYSLLQNQSVQGDDSRKCSTDDSPAPVSSTAKQQYDRIKHQYVEEILLDKWNQVQR